MRHSVAGRTSGSNGPSFFCESIHNVRRPIHQTPINNGRDVSQPDSPTPSDPPQKPDPVLKRRPWLQFAGLGMELAGSTLGLAAIGYAVDQARGAADRLGIVAGLLIGFSFGMYRLIQKAMREVQQQSKP